VFSIMVASLASILLSPTTFLGSSGASKINISCLNGKKYVQNGENVSLNCLFSSADVTATTWFKQTPGEKPLLIASAFLTEQNTFTLNISNTEASDSATYFCAAAYFTDIALSDCTVLVLKDSPSSLYTVLQPPVSDPVRLGGDTTLQCSILTDNSAGDHSVYWFRHGSGESDPGIIFTHGNRSDQCKKSSETVSPTQSCIYKLPKNNLSLSDAGTYYCAVAACGHIFFGDGTKLDLTGGKFFFFLISQNGLKLNAQSLFVENSVNHCLLLQVASDQDLNYAALKFTKKPQTSRDNRRQQKLKNKDTEVYSQIKFPQ
uniref:Ig-like domain-containing protein n=1 Tax=Astyanax mexicanus TaxID=7994 RepID=A0A3B1IJS1_ASTMX